MATHSAGSQVKTWKKPTTQGQPTTPVVQRQTEIPQQDNQYVQVPQSALANIEEMMRTMQRSIDRNNEVLTENLLEMKGEMKKMDDKMMKMDERLEYMQGDLQQNKEEVKQTKQQLKEELGKMENRMVRSETKTETMVKEMEEAFIHYDLEKAAFYLRFQNVVETENENLPKIMADIISGITKMAPQEIVVQMDEIYRINTNYARRHRLPREVHIRFGRRSIKEDIYIASKETTAIYKSKEVKVLRQTPRRVREKRRPYHFLTSRLNRHRIPFRWLIPEGIHVTWLEKKYKISTLDEAKEFYDQNIKDLEERDSKEYEERSKESLEDISSEEVTMGKEVMKGKEIKEYTRDRPTTRAQTGARKEATVESTRAT